jgi:hypothetical protein
MGPVLSDFVQHLFAEPLARLIHEVPVTGWRALARNVTGTSCFCPAPFFKTSGRSGQSSAGHMRLHDDQQALARNVTGAGCLRPAPFFGTTGSSDP